MTFPPELPRVLAAWRADAIAGLALAGAALGWALTLRRRLREARQAQTEAEHRTEQTRLAAEDAGRAKDDFLAAMTRELRTPLNTLLGTARLLGETRLDAAQRGYLATLTTEVENLEGLTQDILDLTRLERGELALEAAPFSPVEVARDTLRRFHPRAEEKRLDLRFEAQVNGPLLLSGDARRFRQIVAHLVDNAIKFTPFGSVTLFLSWTNPSEREPCGRIKVRVRDTGIGLTPEQRTALFQSAPPESPGSLLPRGAGLGLALVQRLVARMGGEVSVQSRPGAGAEFRFSLPLPPIYLREQPFDDGKFRQLFPQAPRILVVDDLATNRLLLDVLLRRNGFQPELATSGEEAVRLATTRNYDAILMDLHMPDIDGFLATARIRQSDSAGRQTPIIALTASMAKGTRFKCLAAGMDEELAKPLDLVRFKHVLATVTSGRRGVRIAGPESCAV